MASLRLSELTLVFFVAANALAQTNCLTGKKEDLEKCDVNATIAGLAAPEAPAFTVLGVTPKTVTRPQSAAELTTAFVSGFDDRGNFQSGIAIDTVPFLWFAAHHFVLGQYAEKTLAAGLIRWAARTSVSIATAKGVNEADKASRLGLGVRAVLWQQHDPHTEFYQCVRRLSVVGTPGVPATEEEADKFENQAKKCNTNNPAWNSSSLVIAGAPSWISNDATAQGYKRNGGAYWSSLAYGIGSHAEVIAHFQRRTGEQIPNKTAKGTSASSTMSSTGNVLQDSTVGGGQFRVGTSEFNALAEGLYVHKKVAGAVSAYGQYSVGLERKLAESLFLDVGYRWAPGTPLGTAGIVANFNWSFNQKPQLAK